MKHSLVRFAIICCTLGHLACDSTGVGNPPRAPELGKDEDALIADGDEGTRAGDGASSLIAIPVAALQSRENIATSELAATVSETGRTTLFFPTSCVTTVRAANVVRWTFADCGGRFGITGLTGTLVITYTTNAAGLQIDYQSENLTIEKLEGPNVRSAAVDFKATATLSFIGSTRKIAWSGTHEATLVGKRVTHSSTYDLLLLEGGCVALDGTATTTLLDAVGTRSFSSTWAGYRRCGEKRACPEAGGVLTIEGKPTGFIVRVKLLGGQAVEVTSTTRPKPVVIENKLLCIP